MAPTVAWGSPLVPNAVRPLARPGRGTVVVLLGILLAGLTLRLIGLDHGLWFDEIQTLTSYVRLPLGTIVQTFDSQNQHLLYSVLARLSVVAFGEHAWSLRLPAVLLGVASLWATFWFGRRVTTERIALLAAALLAVSYHHVWFSQNARGYTGLLLWTLLGSGLFLQLLGEPASANRRRWLWYGLVMALGHYTHGSAFFVTGAHGLIWLVLLARHRGRWRDPAAWLPAAGFAAAGVITLLLYAPVLPHFTRTLAANTHGGAAGLWKRPTWLITETLRGLAAGLPGGFVALGLGALVTAVGTWRFWRQSATVAMVMLLPGIATVTAILALEHNLWPRFFFFSAGFAALIVVAGLFALAERLSPRRGGDAATALLALGCLASATTVPRAWAPKQDFAGAASLVQSRRGPQDAVATMDMSGFVYEHYLPVGAEVVRDAGDLRAVEREHATTWVIYTFPQRLSSVDPDLWQHLQRDYQPVAEFGGSVNEGTVYVVVHHEPLRTD